MARDRETPCKFYVCEGECSKGRDGTHNTYCQRCDKYQARCREHHVNRKKEKLNKIRASEAKRMLND